MLGSSAKQQPEQQRNSDESRNNSNRGKSDKRSASSADGRAQNSSRTRSRDSASSSSAQSTSSSGSQLSNEQFITLVQGPLTIEQLQKDYNGKFSDAQMHVLSAITPQTRSVTTEPMLREALENFLKPKQTVGSVIDIRPGLRARKQQVLGDGDCALSAIGVTRTELTDLLTRCLKGNQNDQRRNIVRKYLTLAIITGFLMDNATQEGRAGRKWWFDLVRRELPAYNPETLNPVDGYFPDDILHLYIATCVRLNATQFSARFPNAGPHNYISLGTGVGDLLALCLDINFGIADVGGNHVVAQIIGPDRGNPDERATMRGLLKSNVSPKERFDNGNTVWTIRHGPHYDRGVPVD
ncbi:hypothetical protein FACS189472_02670 [Alphaproteobacteria bacterium]|nr:hypothetical protein FACS189472_02670 [Alphaproteobacteria bacterium]